MQTNEDVIRRIAENVALRLIRIYANGGGSGYLLPLAADGTRGGVQIGYTTDATNKKYAVQLDNEKMFVNVPWTDHTYTDGTGISLSGNTFSISSTYQQYISHGETAYGWGNHASAGYATQTWVGNNYLALSGGTLTGLLRIATGTGIEDTTGNGMLCYHPTNYTGASSSQWVVGAADCQGVIRSNDSHLQHYRGGSTYDIIDASGGTMGGALKWRNARSGIFDIGAGTTPSGYTTTSAGGNTQMGVISWDGQSDEGGVLVGSDCCIIYNSGDSEYVLKVMDKDVDNDLSGDYSASNCLLAVGQGSNAFTYVKKLLSAGTITSRSDKRVKDIIDDVQLSVSDIAMMPAVRYTRKDLKDGREYVGSIAQNWQRVLPQVIQKDDKGILSLDYQSAALVSTIILARKVIELEAKIKDIENRVAYK